MPLSLCHYLDVTFFMDDSEEYLHEDRIMVGIGEVCLVICFTFQFLVVEDVVNTHDFLARIGVHQAFATLLETIDKVTQHGVVDIGIGHVVEVATNNDRVL